MLFLERVMGLPAALGQCRRQPGELGNDTLYRFRPSRGRSLRVPFPNHHFNKNIPPFGRIFLLERVMGLPAALGQCRRQPGELGNDTLYRFRPSRGRSLRVPFPNHHFNKNIPPFGRIFLLERVMGLEPTISAWKANVLPLHHTRMLKKGNWCGRRDSNSYTLRHRNLNPARLPIPPRPHSRRIERNLVTRRRFELRTP